MEDLEIQETQEETWLEELTIAVPLLMRTLQENHGCVSTQMFRKELDRKGIADAKGIIGALKFFDFDGPGVESLVGTFRWVHKKRSFFTESAYRIEEKRMEAAADDAEEIDTTAASSEEELQGSPTERRRNRQEEARLVTYVHDELESMYASDEGPDYPYVFDVHNQRAGAGYENVDLIAVHWRTRELVELVTVEVKLGFTPALLQQAANYCRFSNRVWIAVPVRAHLYEAASELREQDALLFEAIIAKGIGILACRRTTGRSYEVMPIHWPHLLVPDILEKTAFIERYRETFEEAGVIPPQAHRAYPVSP